MYYAYGSVQAIPTDRVYWLYDITGQESVIYMHVQLESIT